jgi:hypothetical protein
VVADRAGELDKRREAAAPRPLQPGVEDGERLVGIEAVDLAQLFFEQVGAVQALVDVLDVGELDLLAAGQVLGFFQSAKRAPLSSRARASCPDRRAWFQTSRRISSSASVASLTT